MRDAPDQNTLPITAASWSSAFSSAGGRRAVRRSGPARSREAEVVDRAALGVEPGELLRVERVAARAFEQRPLVSAGSTVDRGSDEQTCRVLLGERREIEGERVQLPPPQPGRRSRSSGRAVQTSSIGTPETQSARWSMKSSSPASAQWRSSKTRTIGRCSASPSRNARQAVNDSSRRRRRRVGDADERTQSRAAIQSASSSRRPRGRLRRASVSRPQSSSSMMPACAFTISASAQKLTPSP